MRAYARGVQLEIISSLFIVMIAGMGIIGVITASLAVGTVQHAAFRQLALGSAQVHRTLLLRPMSLRDLSVFLSVQGSASAGYECAILDDRGRPLSVLSDMPEVARDQLSEAMRTGSWSDGSGLPIRGILLLEPIRNTAGETGFVLGWVSSEQVWAQLRPWVRSGIWVLCIAAFVFVSFGSYLLRKSIVAPLRVLSAATRRVAAGELEVRTSIDGDNELAELAAQFNHMAACLERERDTVLQAFESLARNQRLATVGQLAAGVAHEVGNPVAAILGYVEVADRDAQLSERSRQAVEQIRKEALRVRALVRQLLDLARPDPLAVEEHCPRTLLQRVQTLLAPQKLLREIELSVDAPDGLPRVRVDARRLEQVLINLVENAAHALRGTDHPKITLRAARSNLPTPSGRRRTQSEVRGPAQSLSIEVVDNGAGIPPEVIEHVFDPFYTTKDPGEGTGLGLWNAHRLIELLEGRLEVRSRPGETCFSLILPLADRHP